MSSLNIVNLRLRNGEAVRLDIIRRELIENMKRLDLETDSSTKRLIAGLSRHQLFHFIVQFVFLNKKLFNSILLKMAKEEIGDMDEFTSVHGSIQDFANEQSSLDENYVDLFDSDKPFVEYYAQLKREFEKVKPE
jgi:hypothetical protein